MWLYFHALGQGCKYGNKPVHTVELAALAVVVVLVFSARVPAEALVWTAGPSDPSSLLLNWF